MIKRLAPDPAADFQQALTLHQAGRHAEAQRLYRAILKRSPVHAETLHFLSLSLCQCARYRDALPLLDRALAQRPGWVDVLINRGNVMQELGQAERALADFDAALARAPDHPEALCNRGVSFYALGRLDEALADYDRALALRPDYGDALNNRGNALRALNRNDEAVLCFEAALALQPDDAEARLHLAMSRLLAGDYAAAWPDYQWRWKTPHYALHRRPFPQPEWLGHRDLKGRTILVHAEQGYGDTLQFCRYATPLRDMGATVLMEVQPGLKRLLQGLEGTSRVLARGEDLPEFDTHCALLSLPGALNTSLHTIPARVPYLAADPALVAGWAARLGPRNRPRVGLVWSGNPGHLNDSNRSASLEAYAELVNLPCAFVSLQKGLRKADQHRLQGLGQILHLGERLEDFADTAAVVAQLDLVISVDTSVAHLAGALGNPVWVLLPFAPDWRWLLDRRDSPWYPNMRLFRQPTPGDWRSVMAEVAAELHCLAAKFEAAGPTLLESHAR